ncbi:MAG: hypothetical protein ACETWM_13920 [Candidatus Lokiarchaeia archaeon]
MKQFFKKNIIFITIVISTIIIGGSFYLKNCYQNFLGLIHNKERVLHIAEISKKNKENITISEKERHLWEQTVKQHLYDDLWNDRDMYDAGHYLMVPLHAAFKLNEPNWQWQFAKHFRRFTEVAGNNNNVSKGTLNRLHYLYLASRFVVLAEESGKQKLVPPGLIEILYNEVESLWRNEPAWQWDTESFKGGIRERLTWKLRNKEVSRSYYRAITDEEIFLFAIASDLRTYERITKPKILYSSTVTEILDMAYKVFKRGIVFQKDGGWLFQPGVWTDHRDYAYVGSMEKIADMERKPVTGIAEDSSHSHRFPLWLTSLEGAYREDEPENQYYEKLKKGLEKQFYEKVLVKPTPDFPAYRAKNFMDGWNGVYRWGYLTAGKNRGYGPYELSGTLTLGWWIFLDTERIRDVYGEMAKHFPLSSNTIALYVGPNTTRERHPLVKWPESLNNGYSELIARLASRFFQ